MRKFMTREVTTTTIKFGAIVVNEMGIPVVEQFEPIVAIGELDKEKSQKIVNKKFSSEYTVFAVEHTTTKYKMEVAEFIKLATPVTETDNLEEDTDDTEE